MGDLSGAVLRAVYELHERTGDWPTPHAIASHLQIEVDDVRDELLAYRRQKILRMRMRRGARVWMPWGAVV